MKKNGFIGYGSMGSMLINGFLKSGALASGETVVSNRTMTKIENLAVEWKGITITTDNRKVARESDLLFVCVRPLDVLHVLDEIKDDLIDSTHLVSIAGCVTINDIESRFPGQVTKVIPSITSEVRQGISLVCHSRKVAKVRMEHLEKLLGSISRVVNVRENDFEVAADFTSCAPGMIAAIFDCFVNAGLKHSEIQPDVAQRMVVSTLLGTAKLMAEKGIGFPELIGRVATKGGITEEGVKVINKHLPAAFDEVFFKTLSKHDLVKEMIKKQRIMVS
ncbi:MAG: NAD(P)-binding domain-containing protein [Proteobacteria bacterium]|nr:NAD(P)-binding domain-containing protein [Pseudomonadota bacterium]MBU1711482.1 NAD(P)-binding domain-containing protein [Pseudomonadota bacterium]